MPGPPATINVSIGCSAISASPPVTIAIPVEVDVGPPGLATTLTR
jgi:hypothetical protein